jgi:hypothetical protein
VPRPRPLQPYTHRLASIKPVLALSTGPVAPLLLPTGAFACFLRVLVLYRPHRGHATSQTSLGGEDLKFALRASGGYNAHYRPFLEPN